ncbi:MAG TPA: glycosyltransferase [Vicinamibacteria bacterium]|nr:glycosyltransferase [Vicinamibacteria bacterium]
MNALRVGYLLKKFPRLSETFILNEILEQENMGVSIYIISRHEPDAEPRHRILNQLKAQVETLPCIRELDFWEPLFAGSTDRLRRVQQLSRDIRRRPGGAPPRFASLLSEAIYLLHRTQSLGIRHLHVHFASDSAMVATLLRALGGPTYSVTAHAKDIYRAGVEPRWLENIFVGAEFVVTVCDANVKYLESWLHPRATSRVRRLYNGVALADFADAPEDPRQRDSCHVLSVGRLVEKKGHHLLLEALARLRRRGFPVTATLVGEGEMRSALERQIADNDLGELVRLTGAAEQQEIVTLMARATVFCLPCIVAADGNRDALPTVVLEALASGLPVISTPISGIPEILDGGRAGVLVPENDAAAVAAALEDLLANAPKRRELAREGRRRVTECFDLRKTAASLRSCFEQAMQGSEATCGLLS